MIRSKPRFFVERGLDFLKRCITVSETGSRRKTGHVLRVLQDVADDAAYKRAVFHLTFAYGIFGTLEKQRRDLMIGHVIPSSVLLVGKWGHLLS